MNKKLVAVAVAGMLAAPLAAQAQTANVTLYGRLNLIWKPSTASRIDAESAGHRRTHVNRTSIA